MGDGNNIVHSWLRLAARLKMEFVCACPKGGCLSCVPELGGGGGGGQGGLPLHAAKQRCDSRLQALSVTFLRGWARPGHHGSSAGTLMYSAQALLTHTPPCPLLLQALSRTRRLWRRRRQRA